LLNKRWGVVLFIVTIVMISTGNTRFNDTIDKNNNENNEIKLTETNDIIKPQIAIANGAGSPPIANFTWVIDDLQVNFTDRSLATNGSIVLMVLMFLGMW